MDDANPSDDSGHSPADAVWTVIVAAGSGTRFGAPKQFADLVGSTVLDHSLLAARVHSDGIVVVLPGDEEDPDRFAGGDTIAVQGGGTRSESVRAGLAAVPDSACTILVHDAARPLASPELFAAVIDTVRSGADAVIPVVPVTDTIRRRDGGVVDRDELVAVQTPQGFGADALRRAHVRAGEATDDATLVEGLGIEVVVVEGEKRNIKITTQDDLVVATTWIEGDRR